jgi:hypothetical protein
MKYDYLEKIVNDHKEEFKKMFEKFNRKEITDKEWFDYCKTILDKLFNSNKTK